MPEGCGTFGRAPPCAAKNAPRGTNPDFGGGGGEGVEGADVVSDGDGDGGGVADLGGVVGLEGLVLAGVFGRVETSRASKLAVSSGMQARRGRYGPSPEEEATAWL